MVVNAKNKINTFQIDASFFNKLWYYSNVDL